MVLVSEINLQYTRNNLFKRDRFSQNEEKGNLSYWNEQLLSMYFVVSKKNYYKTEHEINT